MKSLYDQAHEFYTPELMERLEAYFGETPVLLQRAVRTAVSTVVGGAIDEASTEEGATKLLSQLQHSPLAVTPQGDVRTAIRQGEPAAEALLGERLRGATDVITSSSNVSTKTARGLLALTAPLVLSVLSRLGHSLDATEFMEAMTGERGDNLDSGPAGVTALVEDGGFSWRHILPMLLMGILLFAVPILYNGCGEPVAPPPVSKAMLPVAEAPKPEKIALPNGGAIEVLPGTINYDLSKFLASTEPAPKRFTFDHLNFEFNKTVITPESKPTLADLVTILKAYPNANVLLEGHTDSIGNPAENKKLSLDRATAIKTQLQVDGIAANRIATAGYGQEKPVASNDTEEGRAKNRRLELEVVKK